MYKKCKGYGKGKKGLKKTWGTSKGIKNALKRSKRGRR